MKLALLSCRSTRAYNHGRTTFRPGLLEHSTLKRGGHGLASGAGLLVTCTRVVARVDARSTFMLVNPSVVSQPQLVVP
ncbi:hypothetical protein HMPREF2975_08625 [Actinomyces sp. HMSC065F12]|nr:hypothetical protein HMPREF2975_08625 [Actinomyces sp. HMSC065F12]